MSIRTLKEGEDLEVMRATLQETMGRPVYITAAHSQSFHEADCRYKWPGEDSYGLREPLEVFLAGYTTDRCVGRDEEGNRLFDLAPSYACRLSVPTVSTTREPYPLSESSETERRRFDEACRSLFLASGNHQEIRVKPDLVPEELRPYIIEAVTHRGTHFHAIPWFQCEHIYQPDLLRRRWFVLSQTKDLKEEAEEWAFPLNHPGFYSDEMRGNHYVGGGPPVICRDSRYARCVICDGRSGETVHMKFGGGAFYLCRACAKSAFEDWLALMHDDLPTALVDKALEARLTILLD